jgi:hypothetical protein
MTRIPVHDKYCYIASTPIRKTVSAQKSGAAHADSGTARISQKVARNPQATFLRRVVLPGIPLRTVRRTW